MSTKLPVLGITDNMLQGLFDLATYKEPAEVTISRLGLPASFINAERGFNELEGVIRQSLDGVDLRGMWNEFQQTLALWNRQRQPLLNLLTRDVTSLTEKVYYPTHEDFEEATEFGEPKGVRLGRPFIMGYDFKWYDVAIRYTWMFLAESDAAQITALNNTALESDGALMFTKVLKCLFNPTNSSAVINEQNVNVYKLYNADGTVPPAYKTFTHSSSHTHYLVSGGATIDPTDLDDIYEHLYHHGYNVNAVNRMVLLVNRAQGAVIRSFKVATGAKYDFIPGSLYGGGVFLPTGQLVAQPGGNVPGEIGTYGPWHVVEEDYVPAGYVVAFVTGGEQGVTNLVGIRQHENSGLRGLRLVKGKDNDYPLTDSYYLHGFGTGMRHRGAGVVMQIKASGTYDIPALYV
jgi:hypothetical protein